MYELTMTPITVCSLHEVLWSAKCSVALSACSVGLANEVLHERILVALTKCFTWILRYATIMKSNSFYDSGTSYLFVLRYDFGLF